MFIVRIQIDDSEIESVLILWDKKENVYLCFSHVPMVSFELFYFSKYIYIYISFCVVFQLSNNLSIYFLVKSFLRSFQFLFIAVWTRSYFSCFSYWFSGILCICLAFCSLSMFIDLSINVLSNIHLLIEPLLLLDFIDLVCICVFMFISCLLCQMFVCSVFGDFFLWFLFFLNIIYSSTYIFTCCFQPCKPLFPIFEYACDI